MQIYLLLNVYIKKLKLFVSHFQTGLQPENKKKT